MTESSLIYYSEKVRERMGRGRLLLQNFRAIMLFETLYFRDENVMPKVTEKISGRMRHLLNLSLGCFYCPSCLHLPLENGDGPCICSWPPTGLSSTQRPPPMYYLLAFSGSVVLCFSFILLPGQAARGDESQWSVGWAILTREDAPLLAARKQEGWSN